MNSGNGGGQASALATGIRDGRMWVNASNVLGAGVTVDVTPDEAEAFAALLVRCARELRGAARNQRR